MISSEGAEQKKDGKWWIWWLIVHFLQVGTLKRKRSSALMTKSPDVSDVSLHGNDPNEASA